MLNVYSLRNMRKKKMLAAILDLYGKFPQDLEWNLFFEDKSGTEENIFEKTFWSHSVSQ